MNGLMQRSNAECMFLCSRHAQGQLFCVLLCAKMFSTIYVFEENGCDIGYFTIIPTARVRYGMVDSYAELAIISSYTSSNFSLAGDLSKRITWLKIPKTGEYPSAKNTIASFWCENMLGYLALDFISSSKLIVFLKIALLSRNVSLLGTDDVRGQIMINVDILLSSM